MVMGNSKNSRVFNVAILLKSRKFVAHEIYLFYSISLTNNNHPQTVILVCLRASMKNTR